MILRTKIDWLQNKVLTKEEQEILEAKREVLEDDYDAAAEEYEETEKDAIIDTVNDKIYIEIEPDKICMIRLLDAQYAYNEAGKMERIEERLYFKSTLEQIYNELTTTNNNK
jgi:hypothetical protein